MKAKIDSKTSKVNKTKTRKKRYYGVVISPFNTTSTTYNVGDKFETNHKGSYEYLINKKIIK